MTNIEKLKIEDPEFNKNKVAAMATIPSKPSAFGASRLTTQQVKERFDLNPELIKKKFNLLIEALPELGSVIKVDLSDKSITLLELVDSISETDNTKLRLTNVLLVGFNGERISLESAIQRIITAVGKKADAEEGRTLASSESLEELIEIEKNKKLSFAVSAGAAKRYADDKLPSFKENEEGMMLIVKDGKITAVPNVSTNPDEFTEGLEYILSDDGTYYICDGGYAKGDIVIPATHEGLPVKEISESAFYGDRRGCFNLTGVVIPDSVKTIEFYAFTYQQNLSCVIFKGKPDYIDSGAFSSNAEWLTGIKRTTLCEIHVPWGPDEVDGAPWGDEYNVIHYNSRLCENTDNSGKIKYGALDSIRLGIEEKIKDIRGEIGGIDTALDELHTYAQSLVGGATV